MFGIGLVRTMNIYAKSNSGDDAYARDAESHNRFIIHSELAQVGMKCWFVAWYENYVGERGPVSNPVSFIVI